MTSSMITADGGSDATRASRGQRPVRIWLYAIAVMIVAMVVVGGATRLTESGLSITEWQPIHGAIPPLNATEWEEEFAKYRQIPQYEILNKGMTLAEFKTIFWWEWAHRFLGRLIGVAFFVPAVFFWATASSGGNSGRPWLRSSCLADCRARSAGGWWRAG